MISEPNHRSHTSQKTPNSLHLPPLLTLTTDVSIRVTCIGECASGWYVGGMDARFQLQKECEKCGRDRRRILDTKDTRRELFYAWETAFNYRKNTRSAKRDRTGSLWYSWEPHLFTRHQSCKVGYSWLETNSRTFYFNRSTWNTSAVLAYRSQ